MNQTGKRSFAIIILLMSILFFGCNNNPPCSIRNNERLVQEYQTSKEIFSLLQVDHGAWGYDVTLRVCNPVNDELIEEIGLRGDDYLPKIDSVIGDNVYIQYNFPRKQNESNIEPLDFESVVLGDALLHSKDLKYNYQFVNIKATQ